MLSAQEKQEKEHFFHDLDRLEDLDGDGEEEDTGSTLPGSLPAMTSSNPSTNIGPAPATEMTGLARTESRKRKRSQPASGPEQKAAAPPPHLDRASTLPEQEPAQKALPKPRLARAATLPEDSPSNLKAPKLTKTSTDLSNLEARLTGKERPKLRPLPKTKSWKPLADIPVEKQVFQGLVFFFVPNNDDDVGVRMRIHLAIKYGASWAHEYSSAVTHILVTDDDIDAARAAKSFTANKIPEGPVFLRYRWLWESWKNGRQPTNSIRFRVPGYESLYHTEKAAIASTAAMEVHGDNIGGDPKPIEATNNAEQHDRPDPEVNQSEPESYAKTSDDALDAAIRDVQTGAVLDNDTPEASGSEDDPEYRPHETAKASSSVEPAETLKKSAGFLCMDSHDGTSKSLNPNALAIAKLQKMSDSYQTSDQFRAKAFRQAIGVLRKQDRLIRTYDEAREIGLGDSSAKQVAEIASTGRSKRLEFAQNDPRTQVVKLFTGVYGAGEATAHRWIAQGLRSLEDVRQKADLSPNQLIGLDHYDDFQQRIPRNEVAQHAAVVEQALKAADPKMQLIIGGSYRRGSKDSGDIDCILFMENADIVHIRTLMFDTVIPKLMEDGFLKVALASGHSSSDDSSKWHGASALPGSEIWRRIDFLFVPWEELGAALIYFTGNDLFNRSIRFLAGKKRMRLNQHGLFKDVMRGPQRQRITEGTLVESHDEKRIFEILGVPYRPPRERNA